MGNEGFEKRKVVSIVIRYSVLLFFGIFLSLFYKFFLPLTIFPSFLLLGIIYEAIIVGNTIVVNGFLIEIVSACVAGSAYYLLLILNLTTKMKAKKRIYSLGFSFSSLLVLNILRIFFLSVLFVSGSSSFDFTHKFFWYVLSIVFVTGIWFLSVKLFKIKEIPVYSELKELRKSSLGNFEKSGKKFKNT